MASKVRAKRQRSRGAPGRGARVALRGGSGTLIIAVIAVAVTLLVGYGVYSGIRDWGKVSDFDVEVYQGQDVLGGSNIRFSDLLAQGKPVVLNFWAGDCPPCQFEMPAMQRVYDRHSDDVIYLGLDVGIYSGLGTRQSAISLLQALNITYPAGIPPDGGPMIDYSITSMPTTVFFDSRGQIFQRWAGTISERQLEDIVNEMLNQDGPGPT